jgi:hypothetical protein
MGRLKNSSYKSYQLLYARLLKGQLWLGDWRSTGLRSRSTVHERLKHLSSLGLVKRRREGHKNLYELVPLQTEDGIITKEAILWHNVLYPISRKERRQIIRRHKELFKELVGLERESTLGIRSLSKLFKEVDKCIEMSENQEVLNTLEKAGFDWKKIPIPKLLRFILFPNLDKTLCVDCLKKGKLSYLIWDHETGEVVCRTEGIVKRMEPFEAVKSLKERPSPFPYKQD